MKPEIEYVYNKLKKLRFDFNRIDFENFRNKYRYEPTLNRYVRKDDNDLFIDKNTFKPLEEELEYADKCHNLEEQLGCPLEVVGKASKKQQIYVAKFKMYVEVRNIVIYEQATRPYIEYFYRDVNKFKVKEVWIDEYKKTWWLKEDKSE